MRSYGKHVRTNHAKSIMENSTLRNSCKINIHVSFFYIYSVHERLHCVEVGSVVDVSEVYALFRSGGKINKVS
jgi:hypothetical protein